MTLDVQNLPYQFYFATTALAVIERSLRGFFSPLDTSVHDFFSIPHVFYISILINLKVNGNAPTVTIKRRQDSD